MTKQEISPYLNLLEAIKKTEVGKCIPKECDFRPSNVSEENIHRVK